MKPCETFVSINPLADVTLEETLARRSWAPAEGFDHTMGTRDGLTLPMALLRQNLNQNQHEYVTYLIDSLGLQFLNLGSSAGAPLLTEILCHFEITGNADAQFHNFRRENLIRELLGYGVDLNIATTQEFISPIGLIPEGATPLWILAEKIRNANLTSQLIFLGAQVGVLPLSSEAEDFLIHSPIGSSREIIRHMAPGAYTITNFIKAGTTPEQLDQEIIRINSLNNLPGESYRPEFGGRVGWTALESCLEQRNTSLATHLLDRYGGHLVRAPRVFYILQSSKGADGDSLRTFTDEEILGIITHCARENLAYSGADLLDFCLESGKENSASALLTRGVLPIIDSEKGSTKVNEIIRKNSWASPFWSPLLEKMKENLNETTEPLYTYLTKARQKQLPDEILAQIGLYIQPKGITLISQYFQSTKKRVESEEKKEDDIKEST